MPLIMSALALSDSLRDCAHLWQDWLTSLVFDVSEWHLGAFMLIYLDLRMINVGYPLELDYYDRQRLSPR